MRPKPDVISIMVGDLQRIKVYPEKGFLTKVPPDVWSAYQELVETGYDQRLVIRALIVIGGFGIPRR